VARIDQALHDARLPPAAVAAASENKRIDLGQAEGMNRIGRRHGISIDVPRYGFVSILMQKMTRVVFGLQAVVSQHAGISRNT
jgi:hypothetical protein